MNKISSMLAIGLTDQEEQSLSGYCTQLGCRILPVKDVAAAKETLNSQKFEVAYLRVLNGDSAVIELQEASRQLGPLPIVLVSTDLRDSLVLEALRAGAADVVHLPWTDQSLEISLQRVSRQRLQRQSETDQIQASFSYLDEEGKERRVKITEPKFLIGRSSGNQIILTHRSVSRSHAEVFLENGERWLRDIGSKQGTYLNGVKVEQAKLRSGDRVQIGDPQGIALVFHEEDLLQSLLASSDSRSDINLSVRGFKEVAMLLAAFQALSSIQLVDDLLALVVDTAIELTGAERGFIMLREENENLRFRCARNDHKHTLDGSCFQTSRRVPFDVFQRGRPVVIKDLDVDNDSSGHSATRQLGLRSISCVPLRYRALHDSGAFAEKAEIIGVLYVDSSNIGTGMSDAQLGALETLASEAAMAIYNAKLYKDSEDKRRMDEQLAIAREIQQALMPQSVRELPYASVHSRNLCCHEVGGDYFDYFNLDGGRFGFALGDVAGKGIPAALLASMIQGIFSAQTIFNTPLPAMMSSVNQTLTQRGTGNRFVTFFFGILEPDGTCTYVNAGHNPPFLVSRDGCIRELTEGGMVLGLFAEAQYEAETFRMQPGDHLVLFTDGVTEALNLEGAEFGKERLDAFLRQNARASAPEILSRLQEAVLSFSAQTPQHDDITIMVLGFQEFQAQESLAVDARQG
jgi:phosphoserine phosphatase RsbU/P